jgi:hypothetical protein
MPSCPTLRETLLRVRRKIRADRDLFLRNARDFERVFVGSGQEINLAPAKSLEASARIGGDLRIGVPTWGVALM